MYNDVYTISTLYNKLLQDADIGYVSDVHVAGSKPLDLYIDHLNVKFLNLTTQK